MGTGILSQKFCALLQNLYKKCGLMNHQRHAIESVDVGDFVAHVDLKSISSLFKVLQRE